MSKIASIIDAIAQKNAIASIVDAMSGDCWTHYNAFMDNNNNNIVFSYLDIIVRIFDVFLLEGFKVIYRFSLAFLKLKEKSFLASKGMLDTINIFHQPMEKIDVDNLFDIAFGFHLSKSKIKKFENDYEKNKNNKNNEFVAQL